MATSFKKPHVLAFIPLLLLMGLGYIFTQDLDAPVLTLSPDTGRVSLTAPLTLSVTDATSPIKRIYVNVRLGNRILPVFDKTFHDEEKTRQETFSLKNTGLKDGPIELEIAATDASFGGFGQGNTALHVIPMVLDSVPPVISFKTSPPYIRRGGSGCVLYSVSKEVSQTGIKVDNLFFPAFRQANGDYLCFFAFPYSLELRNFTPQLAAVDLAGNPRVEPLSVTRLPREFKKDTITISRHFLESKAAEFASLAPGEMSDIERFLQINGRVRQENALTLMELGKNTSAETLWNGPFLRMPRAAPKAGFADFRSYVWEGTKVDEQVHLGFDLASVVQAPVPAANSGRVIFSGYFGIYGNMVIVDHGLGLQSLYSHMTTRTVDAGQNVAKGDIIGTTGSTGMAGGDHLHFGILISGLEVTPLEWLDAHWIQDNITGRVKTAGGILPDVNAD